MQSKVFSLLNKVNMSRERKRTNQNQPVILRVIPDSPRPGNISMGNNQSIKVCKY